MAHLILPGTSGSYAYAADSAVWDSWGSSDLDIRCKIAPDDWASGTVRTVVGRWSNLAANSFQFNLHSSRFLQAQWIDSTGVLAVSSSFGADPGFTDGSPGWIRLTIDCDNGASDSGISFYYSTDATDDESAVSWTQLGTTANGGRVTDFPNMGLGHPTEIGSRIQGTSQVLAGDAYRALIYSGIAGTKVFDADFSDPSTWDCPDKLYFTEKANSATVTLQGNASLVGDCPSTPSGGNRMGGDRAIRKPPR
jgi:hypothetical protein